MSQTTGTPKKILIVEDHADVANVESLLCRMEGYESRVATNALEGWDLIHEFKPDLILLDLMLPGEMSGSDLLQRIKAEFTDADPGPKVLVVSALVNAATTARLEDGARVSTITKPFRISDLAQRVEAILAS